MGAFVPDFDGWWLSPVVVILSGIFGVHVFRNLIHRRVSMDLLENVDPDNAKDPVKNLWTNLAVIAALMLTLNFAMIQIDPIESQWPSEDFAELVHQCQHFYIGFQILSTLCNFNCIVKAVTGLAYLEPLSNDDAIKYFLYRTHNLGDCLIYAELGGLYLLVATFFWILGTYGLGQGIVTFLAVVQIAMLGVKEIKKNSAFNPNNREMWNKFPRKSLEDSSGPGMPDIWCDEDKRIYGWLVAELDKHERSTKEPSTEGATSSVSAKAAEIVDSMVTAKKRIKKKADSKPPVTTIP